MTEQEIYDYLKEHEIYAEVGSSKVNGINVTIVSIEWGDWKHEHAYCDYLMEQINYQKVMEKETEEDGSDCYSSDHFYVQTLKGKQA